MKYKYISFIIITILSFYLTDKVLVLIDNRKPLMKEILNKSEEYNVGFVNAVIDNNTIIPGISGKKVNENKSLKKMQGFKTFNDNFLVYDNIKPDISLDDNKDKIIISGNSSKRNVSIILEEENELLNELDHNILAYKNSLLSNKEYLNAENTVDDFKDLDSILKTKKINKKICIIGYSNISECKKREYYLVSPIIINESSVITSLNNIKSGSIILIKKNTSNKNINLVLNEIKKQDLNIVYLSDLIKE